MFFMPFMCAFSASMIGALLGVARRATASCRSVRTARSVEGKRNHLRSNAADTEED